MVPSNSIRNTLRAAASHHPNMLQMAPGRLCSLLSNATLCVRLCSLLSNATLCVSLDRRPWPSHRNARAAPAEVLLRPWIKRSNGERISISNPVGDELAAVHRTNAPPKRRTSGRTRIHIFRQAHFFMDVFVLMSLPSDSHTPALPCVRYLYEPSGVTGTRLGLRFSLWGLSSG